MKADEAKQPSDTASPNFTARTVDTLARRAGFLCSNPDCRASTVGPNSNPMKATLIGEAAHIFGARAGSKRFQADMAAAARAAITNGIWLCRNCHGRVDSDEERYSSDVLFAWREQHEQFIQSELGNSTDRIRSERQRAALEPFASYPPLIRRIVIDRPDGWEWMLTAELMRYLNGPLLRKLSDLRNGLYAASQEHVDEEEAPEWVRQRLAEMSRLMEPLSGLVERLNQSWGKRGEPGSVEEIHHVCSLFRASLEQIALFEERVYFANGPRSYQKVFNLLRDIAGSQADKLAEIPAFMDELLLIIESKHAKEPGPPKIITKTITLEVSEARMNDLIREFRRAQSSDYLACGPGCLTIAGLGILLWLLLL
jgi:hypothetical protein